VIESGPYRIVRHPGYSAGIFVNLFTPLILGSLYAFIPSGLIVILYVYRTANEDRLLRKELEGYEEYTKRTPYRLIPEIW
jgi:protein-S-isoprenylcysteine O-methyltransferase Ste14